MRHTKGFSPTRPNAVFTVAPVSKMDWQTYAIEIRCPAGKCTVWATPLCLIIPPGTRPSPGVLRWLMEHKEAIGERLSAPAMVEKLGRLPYAPTRRLSANQAGNAIALYYKTGAIV